eukprot:SAG31_NODE_123_length_23712_cov_41.426291_19_plen_122_part_00
MDPADEERARAQSDRRTTTPDGRTSSSRSGMPRSDVEAIRGERVYRKTDHQFLVKYVGFDEYTWEPAGTILEQVADKVEEYWKRHPALVLFDVDQEEFWVRRYDQPGWPAQEAIRLIETDV